MGQSRVRKGIRAAGQFAAAERAEPELVLAPDFHDVLGSLATPRLPKPDFKDLPGPAPRSGDGRRDLMGPGTLYDRNRAWTPAAIRKFLPEPDKEIRNPVIRSGPRMKMFLTSRVEAVEATEEWAAWVVMNRTRSEASARKDPGREETVHLGQGRNGFYPVVRR